MRAAPPWLAFALIAGIAAPASAQIPLPRLEARVTDLTGTLTAAQQSALEEKLAAFEARKGAQLAVLILPTTEPEDIAQFGVRLLEHWKLGRKGIDDGAALIVAKQDRELRIEVQYGLEGVLSDAISRRIIDDSVVPLFKQGDFYGGINAGVDQMIRVIDGESLPQPDQAWQPENHGIPWMGLGIFAIVIANVFRSLLGRLGGASVAGIIGGAAAWWYTSRILFAVGGFVALFLLALMMGGFGAGRRYGSGPGRVFRDIGRGGGFGGWSGGTGGGGWSGGGGRGGGGGASGRW